MKLTFVPTLRGLAVAWSFFQFNINNNESLIERGSVLIDVSFLKSSNKEIWDVVARVDRFLVF